MPFELRESTEDEPIAFRTRSHDRNNRIVALSATNAPRRPRAVTGRISRFGRSATENRRRRPATEFITGAAVARTRRRRQTAAIDAVGDNDAVSVLSSSSDNNRRLGRQENAAQTEENGNRLSRSRSPSSSSSESIESVEGTENRPRCRCRICLESCVRQRPTITKCGHIFCRRCIHRSVGISNRCPACNSKISLPALLRIYL